MGGGWYEKGNILNYFFMKISSRIGKFTIKIVIFFALAVIILFADQIFYLITAGSGIFITLLGIISVLSWLFILYKDGLKWLLVFIWAIPIGGGMFFALCWISFHAGDIYWFIFFGLSVIWIFILISVIKKILLEDDEKKHNSQSQEKMQPEKGSTDPEYEDIPYPKNIL